MDQSESAAADLGRPCALSKPCLDIGYFTSQPEAVLAFWQNEVGLAVEPPVSFNDGLTQFRHTLGDSVVKVNTAGHALERPPTGYRELFIASPAVDSPQLLTDPDGNLITLVPSGHQGVTGIGLRVAVADAERQAAFYRDVMGFEALGEGMFRVGSSVLLIEEDSSAEPAGHWVSAGFRYITVHVKRVDACFDAAVRAGAVSGETPYSIGRIARISFVRDWEGNWLEIAQRAEIAGPWWEDGAAD